MDTDESEPSALVELKQEIEKEGTFEEIVEEYQTLTGVSDGSFFNVGIDSVYISVAGNELLLEFTLLDELTGFIHLDVDDYRTSSDSKIIFSSIDPSNPNEWEVDITLDEDFQGGAVLAEGDELDVNISWSEQIELFHYEKVSGDALETMFVQSALGSYFQSNSDEDDFIKSRVDTVSGDLDGENIELNVNWMGNKLQWTIPTPTNEDGGKSAEFISSYGGINLLESSEVYITPSNRKSDNFDGVFFLDSTDEWVLLSEEGYEQYTSSTKTSRSPPTSSGGAYKGFQLVMHGIFITGMMTLGERVIQSNLSEELTSSQMEIFEPMLAFAGMFKSFGMLLILLGGVGIAIHSLWSV